MNWKNKRNFVIVLLLLLMSGMTQSLAAAATSVSMGDVTVDPGKNVTVSIMLTGITNYGTGTINVEYDPSVAKVTGVVGNAKSSIVAWNANTPGKVSISAWNIAGTSGDFSFADVTFQAVGTSGTSTALTVKVDTLQDTSYKDITRDIKSGSLKISGTSTSPTPTPNVTPTPDVTSTPNVTSTPSVTPTPSVTEKGKASVKLGATIRPAIAIEVTPSDLNFGVLEPGGTSEGKNLKVKNKGGSSISVSTEATDSAEGLFVNGMQLNDKSWSLYNAVIPKSSDDNPVAKLHVADNYAGVGNKEGRLMFWAKKS
jgi:hypothetical protein